MNRRQFLGVVGGLGVSFSGCLSGRSLPFAGTSTPTPPEYCQESINYNLTRVNPRPADTWKVEAGPLGGFALGLSTDSVPVGGQMTARLRNITDEEQMSGTKQKYVIERQTTDGWQSIYRRPETEVWTDEAIPHAPDEGFTWELTVTQDGLTSQEAYPAYYVCDPLEPGTFRFVYWGITTTEERESNWEIEHALGDKFNVTDG